MIKVNSLNIKHIYNLLLKKLLTNCLENLIDVFLKSYLNSMLIRKIFC